MLVFILLYSAKPAVDLPLLNFDTYGMPNIYFDSWSYQFKNCSKFVNGSQCVCQKFINYNDQSCIENKSNPNDTILNSYIIVDDNLYNNAKNSFKSPTEIHYFDVISSKKGNKQHIYLPPNELVRSSIYNNSIFCNFDKTNQTTCNFLVNMCASSMYNPNFEACSALSQVFGEKNGNLNGYYDWPIGQPFFEYIDSLDNVMKEHFVQSSFKKGDVLTFQLARYSKDGEFKGFKELKADLQKCGIKRNRNQIWRQFGWNFFSECDLNLSFAYDTTDFFDIFFQEMYNGDDTILKKSFPVIRPIPILLKNYRDKNGIDVNRQKDETQYKLFRRFFLFDNFTSYGNSENIIQVLSDITISFTIRSTDKTAIQTPYFILEYTQLYRNSSFLPKFSFNVQYTMNMSSFWDAVLYIFIVLTILFIAYWIIHSFLYFRQYNYGGTDMHMILTVVSEFFLILGILLFIICLAFGLFLLWSFKWSKKSFIFLPNEEDFYIFFPAIWVSFGLLAIGILLKIYLQTDLDFFLIDWENPHKKNYTISAWRRVLIGNEWCKISTVRAYSLSFTLVCILLIIKGFNTILTASPIPSSSIIDVGCTYKILRFAYTSFIWLLLILIQYILINFVYWKVAGNPFINFLEICRTAKISCFFLITDNHGFYLHGKKNDLHADVDIESLNEGIDMIEDTEEAIQGKVFEVYLTTELYHLIQEKYYSIKLGIDRREKAPAPYENYNSMNTFLRQFIEQKNSVHKYLTKNWQIIQMIDLGPEITDDSIFTKAPDQQFKYTLMYGIQGILMIFYLVLFTSIDVTTHSPEIGAFTVFIIDWIIFYVFKFRSRYNLSSKGILDSHFLIM